MCVLALMGKTMYVMFSFGLSMLCLNCLIAVPYPKFDLLKMPFLFFSKFFLHMDDI